MIFYVYFKYISPITADSYPVVLMFSEESIEVAYFLTPCMSMHALLPVFPVKDSLTGYVTEGTQALFHIMLVRSPCLMTFSVAEQPTINVIISLSAQL